MIVTLSEHQSSMSDLFGFTKKGLTNLVKKLFNSSDVRIGNLVFTLHQQWTFVIVIIGLIFASSNNYLNKEAMVCYGKHATSYTHHFCFLHGSFKNTASRDIFVHKVLP